MTKWIYKIGLLAFVLVLSATVYSVPKSCSFQDHFRRHLWNEAGQLALSVSDEYCGYYAYDARGERAYKLTGVVFTDQYDAGTIQATASFDDAVLYVNPYMVVTPRGYTKHYYNGSQRIAARIGGYWHDESVFVSSPALTNTAESLWAATLHTEELQEQETPFDEVYVSPVGTILPVVQYGPVVARLSGMHADDLLSPVFSGQNSERTSDDTVGIYFYHSDHLGSANWITNSQGEAVQYIHYMPFGELWENQQLSEYDERFKFTGKERDTETGYDYFGARYYASTLPMWLSVDPLADKYPNISPYAYCSWNPINKYDPNGEEEWNLDTNTGRFQNIGDKGGSITDYYNVGTSNGETFSSYANYEIQREVGTINSFRIQETDKSTISAFHIPGTNIEGFFLERPGPDTQDSRKLLRIPEGQYGLHKNLGQYKDVPRLYLLNEGVGGKFDNRGILIHSGNNPQDTRGCLLPGSDWSIDHVGNSKSTLQRIVNYIELQNWDCVINITNTFK